eukprot:3187430-Prymnesium_polylepis.1
MASAASSPSGLYDEYTSSASQSVLTAATRGAPLRRHGESTLGVRMDAPAAAGEPPTRACGSRRGDSEGSLSPC